MWIGQNTWAHVNWVWVKTSTFESNCPYLVCVVAHKCPFLRSSSLKVPVLFGFATVQYVSVSPVSEQAQICVGIVSDSWFHFSSGQIRCLLLCGGKLCNWQMDFCYTTSVSWYVVCWTVVSTFLPRRHIRRVCNHMSHISRVHLRFATDQCTGSYIIRRAHSQKWMLVKTVSVHEQIESEDLFCMRT